MSAIKDILDKIDKLSPASRTKEAIQRMYVVCRARRFAYLVR